MALASRNASFHERGIVGALLAPLKWSCVSLLLLLGLILAAWTIDWIFVSRVWLEGLARLQSILNQDLARTNYMECWCEDLPKLAAGTANFLYASLFQATGIHDMGSRFADGAALSIPDTIVRKTYIANFEAIQVAMVGTQLFGVRLATLAMAIPLFALVFSVALTDGLVQRAVRRASGGRESASLYHRAKHLQVLLLTACGAISLLLPLSIDSRSLWIPAAGTFGILVRVQWAYYKKHL
jgi:integrating conjugative element membrane protein (TIGR03747 family)